MKGKYEKVQNKTGFFSQNIDKLLEDIYISKFDIKMLMGQESWNPKKFKPNNDVTTPKTILKDLNMNNGNNSLESSTNINSHRPKKSEGLATYNKPIQKTHRAIKSMKLEINKKILVEKMTNKKEKLLKKRKISYEEDKKSRIRFHKQKSDENNMLLLSNEVNLDQKFKSPSKKTHFTAINKLKEENLGYSSLFNIRMRRKTKNKEIEKEISSISNTSDVYNLTTQKKIENDVNRTKKYSTKEKENNFNFQIFIMLFLTIVFSFVKKEISYGFKIAFLPLKFCLMIKKALHNKESF